ncbi:hypothetical protein J8273_8893 [Carpediemonas membranifera]|uniref:Uncharacterized protein n=1 Tax=Carpediemonas membranifera TaxID=201153 RepID=A0A8J6AQP1_9EUKA|nr:hypothetical protein J8273_8893 [Carpediemonas membranifera]|eukprot:KAG9389600.1 hypothetical protein J8273_8893 [Carpediemonas membranifera]
MTTSPRINIPYKTSPQLLLSGNAPLVMSPSSHLPPKFSTSSRSSTRSIPTTPPRSTRSSYSKTQRLETSFSPRSYSQNLRSILDFAVSTIHDNLNRATETEVHPIALRSSSTGVQTRRTEFHVSPVSLKRPTVSIPPSLARSRASPFAVAPAATPEIPQAVPDSDSESESRRSESPDMSLTKEERHLRDYLNNDVSSLSPSQISPSRSGLKSTMRVASRDPDEDLAEALLGVPIASDEECSLDALEL